MRGSRQAEPAAAAAFGEVGERQEPSRHHADTDERPRRHEPQVRRHRHPDGDHGHRDQRPAHGTEAEDGVEAGHDRAAGAPLDLGSLDVHRDVPHTEPGTTEGEAERGHGARAHEAGPGGGGHQPGRTDPRAARDDAACAPPTHQGPGSRQRRERTDREREQQQAQGTVVEVQARADVGHARDQRGGQEPVEGEDDRDRAPRAGRHRFQSVPGGRASSHDWKPVSEAGLSASSTSPVRDWQQMTTWSG